MNSMNSMNSAETILCCLEGNTKDFKRRCEIKVASPDIVADLDKALAEGDKLMANIVVVMDHLLEIRKRFEDHDEN